MSELFSITSSDFDLCFLIMLELSKLHLFNLFQNTTEDKASCSQTKFVSWFIENVTVTQNAQFMANSISFFIFTFQIIVELSRILSNQKICVFMFLSKNSSVMFSAQCLCTSCHQLEARPQYIESNVGKDQNVCAN